MGKCSSYFQSDPPKRQAVFKKYVVTWKASFYISARKQLMKCDYSVSLCLSLHINLDEKCKIPKMCVQDVLSKIGRDLLKMWYSEIMLVAGSMFKSTGITSQLGAWAAHVASARQDRLGGLGRQGRGTNCSLWFNFSVCCSNNSKNGESKQQIILFFRNGPVQP